MKIITIHSDFIEFEPTERALKSAGEAEMARKHVEECLVVFAGVQKTDENNLQNVIDQTTAAIEEVAKQVKTNKIVLYPYVHLVSDPASPDAAQKVLNEIATKLIAKNYAVTSAPFGWYKAFTIRAKGHPLSELSREISPEISGSIKQEEELSGSLKAEEKVVSEWFFLTPEGELVPAAEFDFKGHENLEKFYKYEVSKVRGVPSEPHHAKLMRALELVDYEAGSDPGNLKFYPKGRLIKSILEQWVTDKVVDYGAMEVETPIMYDYEHPALKSYLNRFPARQYTVESAKKKFFLRFSACFGQFLMAANASISYKDLPFKIYELTRYSFRLEKAGELVGLRRMRAFTMPDMHTMCQNLRQAREEYERQFSLCMETLADLGFMPRDYETAIRFTQEFWKDHSEFIIGLVKKLGKPVLIEMWNYRYAYFDPKFEFNFVDSMDKAAALSTVQIDHENGERFGISYIDNEGAKRHPFILHCSPSGAIERVIYALLERAHMAGQNKKPAFLPLWLSPIQVRLCPVSDDFVKDCEKLADKLEQEGIRVDVDDRNESIGKKVRDAELEWCSLILVFGAKERGAKEFSVRNRESGSIENMPLEKLIAHIKEKTKGKPKKKLPLPRLLSQRPIFVGSR